jgi:hypothetical protein
MTAGHKIHRQIGNAVPFTVSAAIGRQIRIAFRERYEELQAEHPMNVGDN